MSLYLVRHGQASAGTDDYDRLSELGEAQAAKLGAYLAELGTRFDSLLTGPLRRQMGTAKLMIEHAGSHASALGKLEESPLLTEFPAFEIVEHVREQVAAEDVAVAEGLRGDHGPEGFRQALERILERWVAGTIDTGPHESFAAFTTRVQSGLTQLEERVSQGERLLAVTSGGPISMMVTLALGQSPDRALRKMWTVANASFHVLRHRDDGWLVHRFNAVPHLEASGQITYV